MAAELRGQVLVTTALPGFVKTDIFRHQAGDQTEVLAKFATPAVHMAKKLLGGFCRGKGYLVRGADAHLLSLLCRLLPFQGVLICAKVMRWSKLPLFAQIFEPTLPENER